MEGLKRRRVPLRDRAGYRFDRTLARSTSTLMAWLVMACLAVVVPVSALLVWTDPHEPRSVSARLSAVWRTSAETLRLGAVAGTPLRMVLSALLGVVALLGVSTLVGVITTGLAERLAELSRGRSTVLERDHAVVLGWSDQVFTVVSELVAAQDPGRPRAVVLLADRDKAAMEESLAAHLGRVGRARVICRSGDPSDPGVLSRVSPQTASTVLVLPSAEPSGDAEVLRTLLALRAVLGEPGGPPVLAAVRDDRYLAPARLAAGPRGTVLETDTVTARLITQCAGRPGLSLVLRDLLDFAGDEFHLADATPFEGAPFGAALLGHPESCVVGLLTPDGRTLLNPPAGTVVRPGSRLILLALDDRPPRVEDCRHLVVSAAISTLAPPPEESGRLLLLGWNRRAPLIVDQVRRTAGPGALLDVVTDPTVPAPAAPLDDAPFSALPYRDAHRRDLPSHGTPPHDGRDGTAGGVPPAERPPAEAAVVDDGPGSTAAARAVPTPGVPGAPSAVRIRSAPLARPESVLALDLTPYTGLIVLGPDPTGGSDHPDHSTLVTLLALRLLQQRTGQELAVVTELTDDRNRPLAPVTPGSDVIVSGELTGLLMAQIAHSPHLAAVFDELFSARGSSISLRPAALYVRPGRAASFATVVAAASARGECAVGYRRHDELAVPPLHGIRLNPPKAEERPWDAADQVIVLTDLPAGAAASPSVAPGCRRTERSDSGPPSPVV